MTQEKKGFTLIELVVVMAIIAVLAALMVGAIIAARRQANNTQVVGDTKGYEVALETYASANSGKYPGATNVTINQVTTSAANPPIAVANTLSIYLKPATGATYLSTIPPSTSIYYMPGAGATTTTYTLVGCPPNTSPNPAALPTAGSNPSKTNLCGSGSPTWVASADAVYVTAR